MDPTDQEIQQAQADISAYLNGTVTGSDAQARAQAAQSFLNFATKPVASGETSDEKQARQLAVQQARQQWQSVRDAASAMDRSSLQGQKDQAAAARQDARDTTQAGIATGRNQTAEDVAGIRAGATTSAAGTRAAASTDVAGIRAGASEAVANINVAGRMAEIEQQRQNDLAKLDQQFENQVTLARQKFDQTKDLNAYTYEMMDIRNQHLQQAMQIRQTALEQQRQAFELPKQQADIAAEQARAKTEQQQADTAQRQQEQQARYQQANLQLSAAKDQSDQAKSAIESGVKLGVAPPEMLVRQQFAPFQMAQEVLKNLVDSGQIDHTRVPEALGITPSQPATAAPTSAPPPLGQFSGYGTPGGYQGAPNPNVFGSGLGDAPVPAGVGA